MSEFKNLDISDELVRRILDEMPAAVFCKDADDGFRYVFWNSQAASMWGIPTSRVIGNFDFDLFPREQAEFFRKIDEETMRSLGTKIVPEEEVHVPAGKYWVRTRKVPLVLSNPPRRFLLGISEDITEDHALRHELELQRALNASTREMAAIGELAGGIAHEINSPLGALVIQMELLGEHSRNSLQPIDPKQIESAVHMLRKTSTRITDITRTLSTYASYSRRAKPKNIRPQTILHDALAISREKLRLANVESDLNLPQEEIAVCVRPMEILQVMLKLIDQESSASTTKRKLSIRMSRRDDQVDIWVAGGKVMSEESLSLCETVLRAHQGKFIFEPARAAYLISLPLA